MEELINKSSLVAEIKRIMDAENENINSFEQHRNTSEKQRYNARMALLEHLLSFINTLEAKEEDIDELLSNLDKDIKEFVNTAEFERDSAVYGHYWAIAKHAFLLGIKKKWK